MANRSYLYSSNIIPGLFTTRTRSIKGIGEYNYDIPLIYKILMSGQPQPCFSLIWEEPDPTALIADYTEGLARLSQLLVEITVPIAKPLILQTLQFLNNEENKSQYLFLECGELYYMEDKNPYKQNLEVLRDIESYSTMTDFSFINEELLEKTAALEKTFLEERGLVGQTLDDKTQQELNAILLQPYYDLGLGTWSNVLYY